MRTPLNCITPIFNWLYADCRIKKTFKVIGIIDIIISLLACIFLPGFDSFWGKILEFLLSLFAFGINLAFFLPLTIGLALSLIIFLFYLFMDVLESAP